MEFAVKFPFLFLFVFFGGSSLVSAQRSTYIVHMDKPFMPKAFSDHEKWYSNIILSLSSTNLKFDYQNQPRILYIYDNALHGFSAVLSSDELKSLKKKPGFVSAYVDKVATLDTTHTPEFLSLNQATGLWPASEYGKDVIVGVIDTGVWPESESYRDDGMSDIPSRWKGKCDGGYDFNSSLCNKKLIGVRYFNKGMLAVNPKLNKFKYSARDTVGHGTHTSSIVAGNYIKDVSFFGYASGIAKGVAPRARVAIYKVLWPGASYASDALAGIDQAIAEGVDVISISMGFNLAPLFEDPIAIASFGAMEKGIFVSCSAGNGGTTMGHLHNGIPWVSTVAASSIDRWFSGVLTLGNGLTINGWSTFPGRAFIKHLPLIYNISISACNDSHLLPEIPYGIVICEDNDNFHNQINFISQSNAAGAIFVSSDSSIAEDSFFQYPGVVISPNEAKKVIKYALKGDKPTASINFQKTFVGIKPAPAVAAYSLRGPSPSYSGILKPDIMAPGTLVLASWIPDDFVAKIGSTQLSSDFNFDSGTSMACPHAAGIGALLKGAHPKWSPAAIRSAMITSANPLDNTKNPIKDIGLNYEIASPLAMGAGQVDPNHALDPGLVYDATTQDYINLLCSMNFTHTQISTITRKTSYKCSNTSFDLNYPSFIVLYKSENKKIMVQKFQRTVTNMGDDSVSYKAKVIEPKGSKITVYPEKLVFGRKYDKQSYSLIISYMANPNRTVTFGSLVWVEKNGNHTVRSPIVVAPIVPTW